MSFGLISMKSNIEMSPKKTKPPQQPNDITSWYLNTKQLIKNICAHTYFSSIQYNKQDLEIIQMSNYG